MLGIPCGDDGVAVGRRRAVAPPRKSHSPAHGARIGIYGDESSTAETGENGLSRQDWRRRRVVGIGCLDAAGTETRAPTDLTGGPFEGDEPVVGGDHDEGGRHQRRFLTHAEVAGRPTLAAVGPQGDDEHVADGDDHAVLVGRGHTEVGRRGRTPPPPNGSQLSRPTAGGSTAACEHTHATDNRGERAGTERDHGRVPPPKAAWPTVCSPSCTA